MIARAIQVALLLFPLQLSLVRAVEGQGFMSGDLSLNSIIALVGRKDAERKDGISEDQSALEHQNRLFMSKERRSLRASLVFIRLTRE
jgi:hypothetical protein